MSGRRRIEFLLALTCLFLGAPACRQAPSLTDPLVRQAVDSLTTTGYNRLSREMDSLCTFESAARIRARADSLYPVRLQEIRYMLQTIQSER